MVIQGSSFLLVSSEFFCFTLNSHCSFKCFPIQIQVNARQSQLCLVARQINSPSISLFIVSFSLRMFPNVAFKARLCNKDHFISFISDSSVIPCRGVSLFVLQHNQQGGEIGFDYLPNERETLRPTIL